MGALVGLCFAPKKLSQSPTVGRFVGLIEGVKTLPCAKSDFTSSHIGTGVGDGVAGVGAGVASVGAGVYRWCHCAETTSGRDHALAAQLAGLIRVCWRLLRLTWRRICSIFVINDNRFVGECVGVGLGRHFPTVVHAANCVPVSHPTSPGSSPHIARRLPKSVTRKASVMLESSANMA